MKKIAPSILDVNKDNYVEYVNQLIDWNVTNVHYDVMDNKFVPNTALSYETIEKIYQNTKPHTMDIHLMVEDVETNLEKFLKFANIVTFHYEAVSKQRLEAIITKYSSTKKLGLAIKPGTDVSQIKDIIKHFKLILVMSVEPGFGGQSFIESTLQKTQEIAQYIKDNNLDTIIQMDGGIKDFNIKNVFEHGCNLAVVGSYLVKNFSQETIADLLK
ncbi:ribulose-phosphate 3-epimerase [[Mycoplasma] gypis]|uniref:Ribulose-phosphate 3-epimerase n=1 Tax=[Mycoplasma] gypis TaxID=92404 RepID=A0ABZ2RMC4_9BACT|nr:ribulose-phosphate 3-epimerase [[Mycoplasma] gypis]MBN0919112.1 ribulose-phosphate 3-epimerase [[Mycoplasma] gypis]